MPIFIGGQHINKPGKNEPDPIVIRRLEEMEPTIELKRAKIAKSLPAKVVLQDTNLIQYKQSTFMSDMLLNDKE